MFYRMRNTGCGGEGRHGRGRHGRTEGEGQGRRGGGRGRDRLFESGDLKIVILALIAEAPRHGYDLIREIEARSGGAYAPSPGVVYPTLTFLEEAGLIEAAETEGAKRSYRLTEAGRDHLAQRDGEVARLMERMQSVRSEEERGDVVPVIRAMANLGTALRLRMRRGDVSAETARKAAALIDELARKIDEI